MMRLTIPSSAQYEFATQFLGMPAGTFYGTHLDAVTQTIDIGHPGIVRLFSRLAEDQPTVLPYRTPKQDAWIIIAKQRHDLEETLARIRTFVVPTYAEFPTAHSMPELRAFDPTGNRLQVLGSQIYPAGYYTLQSPTGNFERILQRLGLWLDLESQRPAAPNTRRPHYRELQSDFSSALAAGNWEEAERCLYDLQRLHLTTADNQEFLRIQLLAQQQQWHAIWQLEDFGVLACLRMPREVRRAMLTAFHYSELLPLEAHGAWSEALETFRAARARLGLLLTSRLELGTSPVVRIFAYAAAASGDRTMWAALHDVDPSPETQTCLAALEAFLPFDPASIVADPLTRARAALREADYDTVMKYADAVSESADRALLWLEIGFCINDNVTAEKALLIYWGLSTEDQSQLSQRDAHVPRYLAYLEDLIKPASSMLPAAVQPEPVQSWSAWFDLAIKQPDDPRLVPALHQLGLVTDERFWSLGAIAELNDLILNFMDAAKRLNLPYTQRAIRALVDLILKDPAFPRSDDAHVDLYETLYVALLERSERNVTDGLSVLRLVEAILQNAPSRADKLWVNLRQWYEQPRPALEVCVLETFDLLAEYGLMGSLLADWYRDWVTTLLDLPMPRERVAIESWLAFGKWIQPGQDLLSRLSKALLEATSTEESNPVAALPTGYRIRIFTFRTHSAERVREALLARNGALDVQICGEKDLSPQARAMAEHADLAVLVTTCISHALTYGIGPYLKRPPLYPQSSGSTSIMRSIEEHLRTTRLSTQAN
jgi:hypothetical protein